ncbi:hypothetical protein JCM24511_08588 [Saitozyma sp. JCM 24511]|nr:hypothetical protein JCM24511_08588 [Saitozyma sp. JCM 24511]
MSPSMSKPAAPPSSPSPFSSPQLRLARLTRLTSTIPGLDASLMLAQYTSPLIVALLLRLARFRAAHPHLRFGLRGRGSVKGGGEGLVRLAEGWGRAAASVADARVIMRAFGLLPVLQGLFTLYPNPLRSLLSIFSLKPSALASGKTLPTLQLLALLAYYPLEHLSWLATKGVVPLAPASIGAATLWSVRFWALYVMLEIYKLRQSYTSLQARGRALQIAKPSVSAAEAEGYELQESSSVEKAVAAPPAAGAAQTEGRTDAQELRADLIKWKDAVLVNSGYAPLTLHWSTPGGLWSSPLVTAMFGTIAASGQLITEWRKGAAA